MSVTQDLIADIVSFANCNDIICVLDKYNLGKHRQDFGHLTSGGPQCILQPRDLGEITAILEMANLNRLVITPRGGGLSQSGQSISPGGVSLDLSCCADISIEQTNPLRVKCGGGATWRQIMQHCSPLGSLPFVMPLNLDLTVAGTLSAGGFGTSSYRFGPAIAHVLELEVVTGAGESVLCSPTQRPEVFHSVLGGLGRCGVIASVTLSLRAFKAKTETYYLLYNDIEQFLADQQWLSTQSSINYLEGFCSSSVQGLKLTSKGRQPFFHWQYGLHVGQEFEGDMGQHKQAFLSQLHYQQLLISEEASTTEFLSRYDARFQQMRRSRAWEQAHPWFECFLPLDTAAKIILQCLEELPHYFGDGHRVMYCSGTDISPIFMQPDSSEMVAFAVLPTGISSHDLPEALRCLSKLDQLVTEFGGKRYLSGWLGEMTTLRWQQHYGQQFHYWQSLKTMLDPNHVLQSGLFAT